MEILLSGVNLSSQALTEGYDETSKSISQEELGNAPAYGRKEARWILDHGELYIRDNLDIVDRSDYTVEYRSERFGTETLPYAEFDDFGEAREYAELIVEDKVEVEELLQ
ncbi:MAG: hypothetical protein ACI8Z7_000435 [Candidatus Nanohaloarchaea archaeon]|jgi:hypothetical protein